MELRRRWYGWWYLAIAAGFAVLALNGCVVGAPLARIATHFTLAGVFLVIALVVLGQRQK